MPLHPLIAAALAKPFTHKVVTVFADGSIKEHQTRGEHEANNWAIGERRKVGMRLIDRETGEARLRVRVTVEVI
jgi:hypothetical protein